MPNARTNPAAASAAVSASAAAPVQDARDRVPAEGMRAGALGFSTSRTLNHRTLDGRHIPTLRAEEAELTAIARAMRIAGAGWLQIVSDFQDQQGEIGLFRRLAKESGRPITITMIQSDARPDGWRELMQQIDEANGRVTVMLSIFGRSTPVDMEYWQIENV